MGKWGTALWKGCKHGVTAGIAAVGAAVTVGANPKQLPLTFLYGFLAGVGVNVGAIKEAK